MIEITGLWLKKSENGDTYMVGKMGSAKVLIFKNKFKSKDNQPDYVFYIDENYSKGNKNE